MPFPKGRGSEKPSRRHNDVVQSTEVSPGTGGRVDMKLIYGIKIAGMRHRPKKENKYIWGPTMMKKQLDMHMTWQH